MCTRRTSSRGGTLAKKLSGGSPASGGDCVDNESRKTDIPRPSSTPPHQVRVRWGGVSGAWKKLSNRCQQCCRKESGMVKGCRGSGEGGRK